MKTTQLELLVGAFVLAGLIAVGFLAFRIGAGALLGADTYSLKARFTNVGGLNPGGSVSIAGVPVGRVDRVELDDTYSAVVTLRLRKGVELPTDTIASIRTSGLIGDKFVALMPGADEMLLKPGELITDTESAVDLESLISRFAFGGVDD